MARWKSDFHHWSPDAFVAIDRRTDQKSGRANCCSDRKRTYGPAVSGQLVAVVETGSIAAAARRENLTAAAISQRIRSLEQTLGAALLDRSAHAAQPTAVAWAVLPRARQIIEACEMLRADVDPTGLSGRFALGCHFDGAGRVAAADAREAAGRGATPGTQHPCRLLVRTLRRIGDGLPRRRDHCDAPLRVPKTIRLHRLRREPLCLIVPREFARLEPSDVFTRLPLIRYDASSWGGRLASRYLDDHRLSPHILCDVVGLEATSLMVEQGIGASLVPQWTGLRNFQPLADGARYAREIVFATF